MAENPAITAVLKAKQDETQCDKLQAGPEGNYFTTNEVSAASLGILEKGLSWEEIFKAQKIYSNYPPAEPVALRLLAP